MCVYTVKEVVKNVAILNISGDGAIFQLFVFTTAMNLNNKK